MKARDNTGRKTPSEPAHEPAPPEIHAVAPPAAAKPPLVEIYRDAVRSRCLDRRMAAWAKAGQLGFYLPTLEWGGALAAAALALETGDWLFPGAREARMALWRGFELSSFLAQHLGLEPQGGPYLPTLPGSVADAAHQVASVAGGPAAHLPHAVGAAWATLHRKEASCAVAVCSSAALDSPDFHVACNFAGVWRVPVVFLVRGDPDVEAGDRIEERAAAYGLAAAHVPGGELDAVWSVMREALQRGRGGEGATLVGIEPPDDDGGLSRLRKRFDNGSRPDDTALEAEAVAWCDQAWEAARAAAGPGLARLTESVYAGAERHLAEQLADLTLSPTRLPEEV
jgi:TPP-dependent pyruvate/acetoin dehydrogenase alpha subunit